jgi:hypothetical protein
VGARRVRRVAGCSSAQLLRGLRGCFGSGGRYDARSPMVRACVSSRLLSMVLLWMFEVGGGCAHADLAFAHTVHDNWWDRWTGEGRRGR